MIDPLNDGKSFVRLVDYMGSDLTVVNAARVSMHKESEWLNEGQLNSRDCGLISYLAKNNHWTPFSHPQIQLHIKMPLFIARQWFKSSVGFTRNEVSRRYVRDDVEFYIPQGWRLAADDIKQGSSEETLESEGGLIRQATVLTTQQATRLYNNMLAIGVCPEQARTVLPQSLYTEFYETASLAAYARLANLRLDRHTQAETRNYAQAVSDIVSNLFPISWEALTCDRNYRPD